MMMHPRFLSLHPQTFSDGPSCGVVAAGVNTAGIWSESIHGDKEQWERQKSLDNFTKGKAKCIVATDVAARGLDIKGVSRTF